MTLDAKCNASRQEGLAYPIAPRPSQFPMHMQAKVLRIGKLFGKQSSILHQGVSTSTVFENDLINHFTEITESLFD